MPTTHTAPERPAGAPYLAGHDPHRGTTVLADADRTGGALGVAILELPVGDARSWHRHRAADVAYLVLDGDVEFRVADQVWVAGAVSLVLTPRGTAHCFQALTDARVALLAVPAGLERYAASSGRAAAGDAALLLALAQEHRVEVLPSFLPDATTRRKDLP